MNQTIKTALVACFIMVLVSAIAYVIYVKAYPKKNSTVVTLGAIPIDPNLQTKNLVIPKTVAIKLPEITAAK